MMSLASAGKHQSVQSREVYLQVSGWTT